MKYLLTNQETDRLRFRKLENADYDVWLDLFYDDEVAKLLGMDELKTASERCDAWFKWTFHRYDNDLGGQNVLVCKETNQIIGQCGLLVREFENQKEMEVAYSILPQHRSQGYATEAATKCRDFAFENNFHHQLISIIIPENNLSKRVAQNNGMTYHRNVIFQNKNMELFKIDIEDWRTKFHNLSIN